MNRPVAIGVLLGLVGTAAAGGLARPNLISAHGVALGGAFVAIADDATAWHFNPAGAAFGDPSVHAGGELVIAPRSYTPVDAAGVRGPEQSPKTPVVPVPAFGVVAAIDDRIRVGAGVWNTYGGKISYAPTGAPAFDETEETAVEVVGGAAYRVNDRFSLGATLRLGIGLFSVKATDKPVTSDLSGSGLGVGAALGALWRPHPRITPIGGVWRSSLAVETTGTGTLQIPGQGSLHVDLSHQQPWPQAASIGVAALATDAVRLTAQLDWTQWSRWERLDVDFPGNDSADQTFPLDWNDSFAARGGVEWRVDPRLALRAGVYFDGNAVPDHTIERQYLDANKVGGALGAGIGFGPWTVDVAADVSGGPARTVPDNSAEVGAFPALANLAPGEHQGTVVTFELAVSHGL